MIANTPSAKEKTKALDLALQQIEKQFGKGAIMKLGEEASRTGIETISTGSIALDLALGVGGVPRGRIVEIYGPESSGKTTLALTIISHAQRAGGNAVFIDAEHALDAAYAQKLGVDIANLHVAQPDTGEEALEIADHLVRSGAVDIVVIDSVAALVPRAEIEGEMGDSHVGLQARLMSQALRKLTGSISKSKTCVVFINQIRMQIGVMFGCFHYDARVVLADGTTEKIGKIVNQKMPVEILSYDPKTGEISPRRVVNWFDNGPTDEFLQIEVGGGPSGRRRFGVTEGHVIFTPQGTVRAGELEVGDEVLATIDEDPEQRKDAALSAVAVIPRLKTVPATILSRSVVASDSHRFDLEVEGNHTYLVDGVVVHNSPETTAGGRALKFYASVRLDIRRIATLKEGDQAVGNRTKVKVVKNKVAAPFREAEFDILYNEGISREGELLDFAIDKGVVQKAGTWFSFGEERIGQGRENARLFLKEHADVRGQIETKLLPQLGLKMPAAVEVRVAPDAADAPDGKLGAPAKPTSAAPARPQPALVAGGDRKR
ncbi:MAG TPA: recombinase RecA [Candidatus Limnocylindria bacterium]|nr:recombinase RecA [Candidatus Limnocylindria bacterium]